MGSRVTQMRNFCTCCSVRTLQVASESRDVVGSCTCRVSSMVSIRPASLLS